MEGRFVQGVFSLVSRSQCVTSSMLVYCQVYMGVVFLYCSSALVERPVGLDSFRVVWSPWYTSFSCFIPVRVVPRVLLTLESFTGLVLLRCVAQSKYSEGLLAIVVIGGDGRVCCGS